MKISLGSLFDGSGGFPLAGCMCGIEPLWASEIEPYPIAVTKARFPRMKHFGDVQKINGAEIDPVDVITFGSPCQDMSIAGKRAGLRHEENGDDQTTRSGLFIEAIRIIREMRQATNGKYPAFAVWENVPGAFSSNGGADFKTVLEELASVAQGEHVSVPFPEKRRWLNAGEIVGDGFSIAWRVLDAQYWGVPQRRKRIYLVADFAGGRAGEILFERKGMSGNPEPGEEARQGAAVHASGGAGGSDRVECLTNRARVCGGITETLRAGCHFAIPIVAAFMGGQGSKAGGLGYCEEIAPTIKSVLSGGNTVPDVVYTIQGNVAERNARQNGDGVSENITPTLNSVDRHSVVYDACGNGDGDTVPTLTGDHENRVTDYTALCVGNGQLHNISMSEQMNTLDRMHDQQAVLVDGKPPRRYIVRRLTPLECCRLQGFPDGWGDITALDCVTEDDVVFWGEVRRTYARAMGKAYKPFKDQSALVKWYNKLHTDSAEYKMWGNGIALPCAVFVISGIANVIRKAELE